MNRVLLKLMLSSVLMVLHKDVMIAAAAAEEAAALAQEAAEEAAAKAEVAKEAQSQAAQRQVEAQEAAQSAKALQKQATIAAQNKALEEAQTKYPELADQLQKLVAAVQTDPAIRSSADQEENINTLMSNLFTALNGEDVDMNAIQKQLESLREQLAWCDACLNSIDKLTPEVQKLIPTISDPVQPDSQAANAFWGQAGDHTQGAKTIVSLNDTPPSTQSETSSAPVKRYSVIFVQTDPDSGFLSTIKNAINSILRYFSRSNVMEQLNTIETYNNTPGSAIDSKVQLLQNKLSQVTQDEALQILNSFISGSQNPEQFVQALNKNLQFPNNQVLLYDTNTNSVSFVPKKS